MFTHIDGNHRPSMVDVSGKDLSLRTAEAETTVLLPEVMRPYFSGSELVLKKGPVFHTAIIAGTMAAKRTSEIIPFCHQIPLEDCKIEIEVSDLTVRIRCRVKTTARTGVEMEALHGASVAALTIYDMCKAISHNIVIGEIKLLTKTGGKTTLLGKPLYGLVLTGGKSSRMGEPKALIDYKGMPHAAYIAHVLKGFCDEVYLSQKENQWENTLLSSYPAITDRYDGVIGAIVTAMEMMPDAYWLVVACDLVHFNSEAVLKLLAHRENNASTAFKNRETGLPEPLCTLYAPGAISFFKNALESDIKCPVKVLRSSPVTLLDQTDVIDLANINTREERHACHSR